MAEIKSPLRYPGGKSRAIRRIEPLLLSDFEEYREPFVGGGSMFIYLKQKRPDLKIWINDLNTELFLFWKYVQKNSEKLAGEIQKIKNKSRNGQRLFEYLVSANVKQWTEFDRAVRFFILNRITFSGVVESGGFSYLAYTTRFTDSSIERLSNLGSILDGVRITNKDYKELLKDGGKDIFTFLDPPYFKATKSKLYGKNGSLHTSFDHDEFAKDIKNCNHLWLITYDDSPEIWNNFSPAEEIYIQKWELQYGMNNYKQGKADKGSELFIANYSLSQDFSQLA
ncbi:MAG: DNA adenine methylase [Anaerolineaceae bacterium]|nr:MAG: DNA adenine methylase [Anaerolineaceae bacterium]